jgi:hypothetical protein
MGNDKITVADEVVMNKIFTIRGNKVMIDRDLAELYGVETRVLNQAVRRNIKRFPKDFMFPHPTQEKRYSSSVVDAKSHARPGSKLRSSAHYQPEVSAKASSLSCLLLLLLLPHGSSFVCFCSFLTSAATHPTTACVLARLRIGHRPYR